MIGTSIDYNLIKAFKENFENTTAYGSYFSYLKKIYKKAKKSGLIKKEMMEFSKNILFDLMIIVFIKKENIKDFFKDILEYIKQISFQYKPYFDIFMKYHEEKIININYINFKLIKDEKEWKLKTNNIIEYYNSKMSNSIEHFFPKMYIW